MPGTERREQLREPLHRRNAYTRVLNWYERYVKNSPKEAR